MLDRDAKNLYQVQQSTVKYRFSFRTLFDRTMKAGCYAIFFCGNFQFTKNLITQEIRQKRRILRCERMETIIYFRKNVILNHHFIIKKNKRQDARLRKPNYESSLVANILPN